MLDPAEKTPMSKPARWMLGGGADGGFAARPLVRIGRPQRVATEHSHETAGALPRISSPRDSEGESDACGLAIAHSPRPTGHLHPPSEGGHHPAPPFH